MVFGLLIAGGSGIAIGIAIGAGVGVAVGAAVDAENPTRENCRDHIRRAWCCSPARWAQAPGRALDDGGLTLPTSAADRAIADNALAPTGLGFDAATWTATNLDEHLVSATLINGAANVVADPGPLSEIEL